MFVSSDACGHDDNRGLRMHAAGVSCRAVQPVSRPECALEPCVLAYAHIAAATDWMGDRPAWPAQTDARYIGRVIIIVTLALSLHCSWCNALLSLHGLLGRCTIKGDGTWPMFVAAAVRMGCACACAVGRNANARVLDS